MLEAVGGKVPVTITGKFPEKYFKKNAIVEVTVPEPHTDKIFTGIAIIKLSLQLDNFSFT